MRRNISRRRSSTLVSTAAVLGGACSLLSGSAFALELTDIQVESSLGQPLRASIGFSLNPNEQMFDFCVRLQQGVAAGPIPSVTRANVSVVGNRIVFAGNTAVKDPLLNLRVIVDCPYTPQLTRQYTLVVDPVEFLQKETVLVEQSAPSATDPVAQNVQTPETSNTGATAAAPVNNRSPIEVNSVYRVQSGDSVSAIASRIEGRTASLQNAVAILVASNPNAFVDGDAGRLMAGSLLTIPSMTEGLDGTTSSVEPTVPDIREFAPESDQAEPATIASESPPTRVANRVSEFTTTLELAEQIPATEETTQSSNAPELPLADVAAEAPTASDTAAESSREAAAETVASDAPESVANTPAGPAVDELRPGDVIVAPAGELPATETTPADAPVAAAAVDSAVDSPSLSSGDSWAWLSWPIGGALLLVGGILLLGRQIRQKFVSVAIGDPQKPAPPKETLVDVSDENDAANEELAAGEQVEAPTPVIEDVDFQFDDTINGEAISLDADLDAGTGLRDSDELDVAEDFGFADSGEVEQVVDHQIPAEAAQEPENAETDIIPPTHKASEPTILDAETVPEDDYDMSMIVDATKQNIGDTQLTVQDLQAVPLDPDSSDSYAISDDKPWRDSVVACS